MNKTSQVFCVFFVLASIYSELVSAQIIDDRFFDPAVYSQLGEYQKTDGWRVDPNQYGHGEVLTKEEVGAIAIAKMEKQASELRISPREITKSMFEGRFNPYFKDLELVFEGLGRPINDPNLPDEDMKPLLKRVSYLIKNGISRNTSGVNPDNITMADVKKLIAARDVSEMSLQGSYGSYKAKKWNGRFGSIEPNTKYQTFVNGEARIMTGKDLALRRLMRLHGNRFEKLYHLPRSPDLTYADAIKTYGDDKLLISNLNYEINQSLHMCAFGYFGLMSTDKSSKFNLNKDYQFLRTQKYVPSLRK